MAIHYDYPGPPFRMRCYCRPTTHPSKTTQERSQVTCKDCLKKLARFPETHGVRQERSSETVVAVHALRAGIPLCQFTTASPVEWPGGHVWVACGTLAQVPLTLRAQRCQGCLDAEAASQERSHGTA